MRTIFSFCGIIVLALSGAGCAGFPALSHPVAYAGHGAVISGSSSEPPSSTIMAAGSVRATTVVAEADAHATRVMSDAEATRVRSHAGISRAHALLIAALTPELAACMHGEDDAHERDFSTCIGRNPQLLQVLLSEDPSFGSYLGGGVGGPGYYFPMAGGGYDPTALADTYNGYGSVGAVDMSRRVERLEGAVGGAVDMFHDYTTAGTTEGGAR